MILRGVNSEGIANVIAFRGGMSGLNSYIDKATQTDATGSKWYARAIRLNFERYPCTDTSRLYQAGDPRNAYTIPEIAGDTQAVADAKYTTWMNNVLNPAVQRAVDNGLYAIITDFDFGPADHPLRNARMIAFWSHLSKSKWANHPQVLFDLWNESEDVDGYSGWTWSNQKANVQSAVNMIRANGANNIVIVTTPAYCAFTDLATSDPLVGTNIVYAGHQYSDYFSGNSARFQIALSSGQAVILSEWGVNADTNATTVNSFIATLQALLEPSKGATHPAIGWLAWSLSDSWSPDLYNSGTLTTPTAFGTGVRQWLFDMKSDHQVVP